MKIKFLSIFLLLFLLKSDAQESGLSPRVANYKMDIRLDPVEKKNYGETQLLWKNISTDTVSELQFHLYMNAFKNSNSTFMRERENFDLLAKSIEEVCGWSWVEIHEMVDEHGNNLTAQMAYIQPDDDNVDDQTVLQVKLPTPVLPGESITVDFSWTTKIPRTMPRTGYNQDFYFFAQWFPKVGVYEPAGMRYAKKGGWNCHQYHSSGEYYSDFGVYEVNLTVPSNYVVGASGELVKETTQGNEKTFSFVAEDVIDFSWGTSPHFQIINDEWKGIKIRLLTYPEHAHFADRYLGAAKNTLEFFDEKLERYPYPGLTIISPPIHGIFTGGMEYPTLITSLATCLVPVGITITETLTVHELIHQYFMQMVATHEVEDPWMDEGLTTYYEGRIMDKYYGEQNSAVDFCGIEVGNVAYNRGGFFGADPDIAENTRKSWQYKEGGYGPISYNKTGVWLRTLEGMVGLETMDEIMKTYFTNWKFKHPCRQDFIDVVNSVVTKNHGVLFGENMDWFFEQVLYGTALCDYEVAQITNEDPVGEAGFVANNSDCVSSEDEVAKKLINSKVVLKRNGEMQLPLEVLIRFASGEKRLEKWDGKARSKTFSFSAASEVISAEIDPEQKLYIDKNFINNSRSTEVNKTGIRKYLAQFTIWMQNTMQSLTAFI